MSDTKELSADDVLDLLEARAQCCREEGESDMRNILNTIRFIRDRRSEGETGEQIRAHFRDDEQ